MPVQRKNGTTNVKKKRKEFFDAQKMQKRKVSDCSKESGVVGAVFSRVLSEVAS
jgi:hypothetical protein